VAELCDFLAPQYAPLDPEATAVEATSLVERFLRTPRAAELAASPVVRREVEFLLPCAPAEEPTVGRYLHGFIDCVYQDAHGRWRLLDYKTNRLAAGGVKELADRYELQMMVYALACEQALGESLAECALIALATG